MQSKIPYKEMKALAEEYDWLEPGQFDRKNHNTDYCQGDSKSLKISLGEDNGQLRATCYRCGRYGFYTVSSFPRTRKASRGAKYSNGKPATFSQGRSLPSRTTGELSKWEPKARVWWKRYGLTEEEQKRYSVTYSEDRRSVIIPCNDGGWQERTFADEMPKYISHFPKKGGLYFFSGDVDSSKTNTVVIVEDALSAIKVGRQLPTYSLQGVMLSESLLELLKRYNSFIIWLDNDNRQVKMKQQEIATRLSILGDTKIIKTANDPKEYTDEEIKEILST